MAYECAKYLIQLKDLRGENKTTYHCLCHLWPVHCCSQLLQLVANRERDCSLLQDYCNLLLERIHGNHPEALGNIMCWLDKAVDGGDLPIKTATKKAKEVRI